ncbi:MAG: Clp protease N-terminal domain-containing protein [Actinobacteria bacterium]|nr:Clp protease N-terminal domain-containing protein [Actinomycetota bacterium]
MLDKLRRVSAAPRDVMVVLRRAEEEARLLGAPTCEAEHILLGLMDEPTVSASGVLSSLGLSRERIIEALERELVSALARANIHVAELPGPRSLGKSPRVRWGESAQRLVERSIRESADDPSLRMLLAIVHAEGGVIPRLLPELRVSVGEVEMAVAEAT